jgi:hypothetical protein
MRWVALGPTAPCAICRRSQMKSNTGESLFSNSSSMNVLLLPSMCHIARSPSWSALQGISNRLQTDMVMAQYASRQVGLQ